jgi:hypothetical protein
MMPDVDSSTYLNATFNEKQRRSELHRGQINQAQGSSCKLRALTRRFATGWSDGEGNTPGR